MEQTNVLARNVLCVLHDTPEVVRELCEGLSGFEFDEDYSGMGPDNRMTESFAMSECTVSPSLSEVDISSIADHKNVAYVLSPRIRKEAALDIASQTLRLVESLFAAGARAIKCESSGLTHGMQKWRKLAESCDAPSLYWAWVRRPLVDNGVMYSCGMHLLGHPDIEIVTAPTSEPLDLIDGFCMYLLVDVPGDRLQPGHTFSLNAEAPKQILDRTVCKRYEDDEFFCNPEGYWRLQAKP